MGIRRNNRGSAVIELALLMPVILGFIYLYIMLFLFFTESGKWMAEVAEGIYAEEGTECLTEGIILRTEGETRIGSIQEEGKLFKMQIELRRDKNDAVKNIRRWQLIGDVL